jgi:hypothetical protein
LTPLVTSLGVDTFQVFDKRGTRRLPVDTIKQPFTDDQIAELISQADVDAQGTVDYGAFVKVMLEFSAKRCGIMRAASIWRVRCPSQFEMTFQTKHNLRFSRRVGDAAF